MFTQSFPSQTLITRLDYEICKHSRQKALQNKLETAKNITVIKNTLKNNNNESLKKKKQEGKNRPVLYIHVKVTA